MSAADRAKARARKRMAQLMDEICSEQQLRYLLGGLTADELIASRSEIEPTSQRSRSL